ncbi:S8 family serine peptidase [Armatimonas sp.]|uniref:S8 family serine peptidase n=1 Tax=Armatimonas sp. TaxID=1872638 RepID=UPI00286D52B6|nr:S8 family serine peptidase [Armatimonas sp.]
MKLSHSLTTLTALTLLISPASHAQSAKTDAFLTPQLARTTGWSSVIVRSTDGISKGEEAQLKALGGDIYRHLSIVNSVALRLPTRNLKKLVALSFVERLSADLTVKKTDEFTVGHSGADIAWSYGFKGTGVGVAVLDSGVTQLHPDLATGWTSRVVNAPDFVGDKTLGDPCGHGSHVAGIIAGDGSASSGSKAYRTFYGTAPDAKIINLRVLDKDGQGSVSNAIAAIQWAIANKSTHNIRVLNLSVGHEVGESYKTDPLCQAVETAWKAGIVVVCAVGNGGRIDNNFNLLRNNEGYGTRYGSIQSPANDPFVISVGAVKNPVGIRALDRIATYSSRGPTRVDMIMKPDLVAPGNRVISLNALGGYNALYAAFSVTNALPWNAYLTGTSNGTSDSMAYFYLSGTSMAAPVVAGAAALLIQKDPTLSPDTVKARLMLSADKYWNDPATYGAGLLNIPGALNQTAKANRSAFSPILKRTSSRVRIDANKAIWGETEANDQAIWGVSGITSYKTIWGTQAIWGEAGGSPYLAKGGMFFTEPVWEDKAIWGVNTTVVDLTSTTIFGER